MPTGDCVQCWDFDVNVAMDSAWENTGLDLLDPGQIDSCSYQGTGYEGEMKLGARFSAPYVLGLLEALDFM